MALDAFCDLVLGGTCAACARPGRLLCPTCRGTVASGMPTMHRPRPCPPGFPTTVVTGHYDGAWPRLLAAYKEHGARGLGPTLAARLWPAVGHLAAEVGVTTELLVLVPVPSSRAAVRARGLDTTAELARQVAARARRAGHHVPAAPVLRLTRRVADSTGLDAAGRRANLAEAVRLPPHRAAGLRAMGRAVLLCDDLVTTGASLTEAARAVEAAGVVVAGAVTLVATPRHPVRARDTAGDAG